MNKLYLFLLAIIILFSNVNGQSRKSVLTNYTTEQIVIDGKMAESSWFSTNVASDFHLNSPNDTAAPSSNTEVRILYDEKAIYFFAIMYQKDESDYVIQSLRRDWDFARNDNFSIYFDAFNDLTTGFSFGISPYGVLREGLMFEGANVSTNWDNVWYAETQSNDTAWTAEIKIPFKSIRYNKESEFWNLMFLRNDLKYNEVSTWTQVPQQFNASNLAYSGALEFENSLPKPGPNVTIIPFVAGREIRQYDNTGINSRDLEFGADAKVGITPSLNLDLTFNPDFSQVEVDRQVTNLDRFELFFPERRQFFLENDDLFGRFGYPSSRVFFSRRIGLQRPITYGTRLSGKASDNLRIGFLNIQDASSNMEDTLNNTTVAVFQHKLFSRSNISGIFLNRQGYRQFSDTLGKEGFLAEDYNRVTGLEYNLLSSDNKWEGDFYYFQSFTEDKKANNYGHGAFLGYNTRNLFIGYSHEMIGENYELEVGFLPRKGFNRFGPNIRYNFWPKAEKIIRHGPSLSYSFITDPEFNRLTDSNTDFTYAFRFLNTSELSATISNRFIRLIDDFVIGFDEQLRDTLRFDQSYNWQEYQIDYNTDTRKKLFLTLSAQTGGFYDAQRTNVFTSFNWRFQPFGSLAIDIDYNYLDLVGTGLDAGNWLISPRLDLTMTRKLFLTTFVQYNEQIGRFNLNSRLQWRFKPVSDFYIVYTENYFSNDFRAINRALVFKLTYWLNV